MKMPEVLITSDDTTETPNLAHETEALKEISVLIADLSLGIDIVRYQELDGMFYVIPYRGELQCFGSFILARDDLSRLKDKFNSLSFVETGRIAVREKEEIPKQDKPHKKSFYKKRHQKPNVLTKNEITILQEIGIPEIQVVVLQKILNDLAASNSERSYLGEEDERQHVLSLRQAVRAAVLSYKDNLH